MARGFFRKQSLGRFESDQRGEGEEWEPTCLLGAGSSASICSLSARRLSRSRQTSTAPEALSTKLSIPKPSNAMLPAANATKTATIPSTTFHAIVSYLGAGHERFRAGVHRDSTAWLRHFTSASLRRPTCR